MWFSWICVIFSQAIRVEISGFLQQLRFEVTRKDFNTAALQSEMLLRSQLENRSQVAKLLAGVLWWMGMLPIYLLRLSNLSFLLLLCMPQRRLGQWDLVIVILHSGGCYFCWAVFAVPYNSIQYLVLFAS